MCSAQNIFNNQQVLLWQCKAGGGGWRRWGVMMPDDDGRFGVPSSLNDDNDGAEEDEAAIDIDINDDKREDATTRSLSVCQDDITMMMSKSLSLLVHRPPPCGGLPLQREKLDHASVAPMPLHLSRFTTRE